MAAACSRPARNPESYSSIGWLARRIVRNYQWSRTQGIARFIEEHDLRPVARSARALEKALWRRRHGAPAGSATAVLLAGVQRSGTNMMYRALAESPEFEPHNDGDAKAFYHYRIRPTPVVRDIVLRSRQRFVLFRLLHDSHLLDSLLDDLDTGSSPRAIWAYRDVDGRVRSALAKFGPAAHQAMSDIAAGTGLGRWQAQRLSDESLAFLCSVDWTTATPADGAAAFWYVRNQLFFDLGLDARTDVFPLSYDVLVTEPENTMAVLCAFLGATYYGGMVADIDSRAIVAKHPVRLQAGIRERCEDLAERLDAAAAAVVSRLATSASG